MAYKKVQKKPEVKLNLDCPFCKDKSTPNYHDFKKLKGYLSDRGKILGRARTGVCSMHQRSLSLAIKRARFLALLPYSPSV